MLIADILTISLAAYGYIEQYLLFRKTKSTGQFSIYITAIMIFACILKALFYAFKPYSTALFIQNFILIFICLLLIQKYVELNQDKMPTKGEFLVNFWIWPTFFQYIRFIVSMTCVLAIVVYYSISYQYMIVGETMASVASVIEITAAVPQIIKLFQNKSAKGVSRNMVLIWFTSDTYKTIYFILKEQPLQFVATGFLQACLDLVLIGQLIAYRSKGKQAVQDEKSKKIE